MENDETVEYYNEDFPIMVADGAFSHFLDDFVSLYFYQNRILPPRYVNKTTKENTGKREIIGEIRMSENALNKLVNEICQGLKIETASKIAIGARPHIWTDPTKGEKLSTQFKNMKITKSKEDMILFKAFTETYDNINPVGRKKLDALLANFFHDSLDDLNNIREKYPTKRKTVTKNAEQ